MEDALRGDKKGEPIEVPTVLILVLMEDALRVAGTCGNGKTTTSLNPCSNGRCSASLISMLQYTARITVLILVLMEDALRGIYSLTTGPPRR